MLLAAASAEPNRGWGGPLAILAAFVVFRVVVMPVSRWVMAKINNPSPTPALPTAERVKVKATVGVTPDDTDDTPEPEEEWWGRIVERNGHFYRVVRQVMATGSHELPPDHEEPAEPDEDPEIDLALDDDEPEDAEKERGETVEEYIERARRLGVAYGQIVKVLIDYYDISESTAKRRIRAVDESQKSHH